MLQILLSPAYLTFEPYTHTNWQACTNSTSCGIGEFQSKAAIPFHALMHLLYEAIEDERA